MNRRILLTVAGCAAASATFALPVTFEMPFDGKASVIIDDAQGFRVRNLVNGVPYAKGRHTVEWDGRAEDLTGAEAGRMTVRVFAHEGLTCDYKGPFAAGGEKMFSGFGPNHLPCSMSMARGDRVVIAALFTEGGNSTLVLDLEGRLRAGWGEGWELGNHACVYLPGTNDFFYAVREKDNNALQFMGYTWSGRGRPSTGVSSSVPTQLKGAAQIGGKVYVANGLTKTIDVYTIVEGENWANLVLTEERIPCPLPGPLTVVDGRLVQAFKPEQVSIASDGRLVYAVETGSQVIHVYDAKTRRELRTIGEDGGGYTGLWRKDRLVNPTSCALDSAGFLWVTERRYNPKRITRWDVAKGTCVYEKIGSEKYGSPGCGMDGADATRWMAHDTEWRYDPDKGVDYPIAQVFNETPAWTSDCDLPPRDARTYRWVHRGGKTYVIGIAADTTFWEYLENEHRFKPLGFFGTPGMHSIVVDRNNTCAPLQAAYLKAFPEMAKDPLRFKWDEETLMVWHDRNGDERVQEDEIEFAPRGTGGTGFWGTYVSDLDFTVAVTIDGEFRLLDFKFPEWSLKKALERARPLKGRMPNGLVHHARVDQLSASDGRFVFACLEPYMLGADKTGKMTWYMKNPHVGVHGSHDAPMPRPGELQGVLFPLGLAPCGRRGEREAFAIKNNHGRVFFITTDGVYLDEMFSDCRVAAANNETFIGGESFGGSFAWDEKGKRAVLTSGGGGYRFYEVKGLDTLEERTYTRTFTAKELVEAQEAMPLVDPKTMRKPVAEVHYGTGSRLAEWRSAVWGIGVDGVAGDGRIGLTYQVDDPSPWVNNGTDRFQMFKTGDCVDFQFVRGKDPVRVMVYPKGENGAEAVVYDFNGALAKLRGEKPAPHDFASPWRTFKCAHVFFPGDLDVRVERRGGHYAVSLSVPLEWLSAGGKPLETPGDFGVVYGDRDGTINQSRVYWSNKATGLVNDVPGEIMPPVANYGVLKFDAPSAGGAEARVRPAPKRAKLGRPEPLCNPNGNAVEPNARAYQGWHYAAGVVYDAKKGRLYYSSGTSRISAMNLKGVVTETWELAESRPFDRFDSITLDEASGEIYVLAGGLAAQNPHHQEPHAGKVYRIRPSVRREAAVACVASNVCCIARHVRDGRLACILPDSTVGMLSLKDFSLTHYGEAVRNGSGYPCMLDWTPQGELMSVVEHFNSYVYRDGKAVPTPAIFGREIAMTKGWIFGDELWSLSGGTIKRYDARTLKPDPGVVYGGASGYFIGFAPLNNDMDAVGICKLGPNRYAVQSSVNSAIYLMKYDPVNRWLNDVSRLGGVINPVDFVVDREGVLLCDAMIWRFDAKPSAPPYSSQTRMSLRAAALLPSGRTLYVNEQHGNRIEFRSGMLADGWFGCPEGCSVEYPEGAQNPQHWDEAVPAATVIVPTDDPARLRVVAIRADGLVKSYAIQESGRPVTGEGFFSETKLPLPDAAGGNAVVTSAACMPDGWLFGCVGGTLCTYVADGAGWKLEGTLKGRRVDAIAADGNAAVFADAKAGRIAVMAYAKGRFTQLTTSSGLAGPAKLAFKGDYLAVWERDARRVTRFKCTCE